MRFIVTVVVVILLYYALKSLVRSTLQSYRRESGRDEQSSRLPGEEMVLDPQCRTYVPKGRAIVKTRRGGTQYFCSEACAADYERLHKG